MIIRIIALLFLTLEKTIAVCNARAPSASYIPLLVGQTGGGLVTSMAAAAEGPAALTFSRSEEVNGTCGEECLFTLAPWTAPHARSSLYVREELNEFVPLGYNKSETDPAIHCARGSGVCGATIPIYRYFLWNATGIFHTYSLEENRNIAGYTKEMIPLCYAWRTETTSRRKRAAKGKGGKKRPSRAIAGLSLYEVVKRDTESEARAPETVYRLPPRIKRQAVAASTTATPCSAAMPPLSSMAPIVEWTNGLSGSESDHFYTTLGAGASELAGYRRLNQLGMVLNTASTSCSCTKMLVQTYDNQTGIFRRIDHKLMTENAEMNRIFEQYRPTGERMWCAATASCGATIPLYKHFDYVKIDSLIMTSADAVPPNSYRYPLDPLCWIWASNYSVPTTPPPPTTTPSTTRPTTTLTTRPTSTTPTTRPTTPTTTRPSTTTPSTPRPTTPSTTRMTSSTPRPTSTTPRPTSTTKKVSSSTRRTFNDTIDETETTFNDTDSTTDFYEEYTTTGNWTEDWTTTDDFYNSTDFETDETDYTSNSTDWTTEDYGNSTETEWWEGDNGTSTMMTTDEWEWETDNSTWTTDEWEVTDNETMHTTEDDFYNSTMVITTRKPSTPRGTTRTGPTTLRLTTRGVSSTLRPSSTTTTSSNSTTPFEDMLIRMIRSVLGSSGTGSDWKNAVRDWLWNLIDRI